MSQTEDRQDFGSPPPTANFGRNYFAKLAGMGASDSETKLIVPAKIAKLFSLGTILSLPGIVDNYHPTGTSLKGIVEKIITSSFLTLNITEIVVKGEHVMPTSKGIGSIGEIIHVMGARNEKITLNFTTDSFPGSFSGVLKVIIQSILQSADVLYVIDDLIISAACLLKSYELKKVGRLKTAVIGTMVLEVLPVDTFGLGGKVSSFAAVVLTALATTAVSNTVSALPTTFRWMADFLTIGPKT